MPVNYHNNKEGNKWWCQKGATRFLKQWGQKSSFFFALFSVTDVNVLSCGSDLIRHSRMDFIVSFDTLFISYNDDEGLFFPNRMRRGSFARNVSLIMNSPYSCTKANNKAEHSNHWAHRNTPCTQARNQTQAQGWTKYHHHPPWISWVGE